MSIKIQSAKLKEFILYLVIAVSLTIVVDMVTISYLTNDYPDKYNWDHFYYINMVQTDNWFAAPFAYRFGTPLMVRGIVSVTNASIETGFRIVAYLGVIGQILGLFYLGRHFQFSLRTRVLTVFAAATYFYNMRFLMFNVYQVDQMGLALLLLSFLMLLRRNIPMLVLATVIGLQFREFVIIPAAIFVAQGAVSLFKGALNRKQALEVIIVFVSTSVAVIVPRLFIETTGSLAVIEPKLPGLTLQRLMNVPLDIARDLILVYYLAAYLLPLLLLITPRRLSSAWGRLEGYRFMLAFYSIFLFVLVMYAGTDIGRFMPYYCIPMVIMLGMMLEEGIPLYEIIFLLMAVAIFNKVHYQVPNHPMSLLIFYGAHENRGLAVSVVRFAELLAFWGGMVLLRFVYGEYLKAGRHA